MNTSRLADLLEMGFDIGRHFAPLQSDRLQRNSGDSQGIGDDRQRRADS
jgi:hypothetical protein